MTKTFLVSIQHSDLAPEKTMDWIRQMLGPRFTVTIHSVTDEKE